MSNLIDLISNRKTHKLTHGLIPSLLLATMVSFMGLLSLGPPLAHAQQMGGSLAAQPSSGTYNIGDTINVKLSERISFSSTTGYYLSDLNVAYDSAKLSYVGSTCNNSLVSCDTLSSTTRQNSVYAVVVFTPSYLRSHPNVYMATLKFKVLKSGSINLNLSGSARGGFPQACSDIPYKGCQGTRYALSYSNPTYAIRVSCSAIAHGKKCSNGKIECNKGYHKAGTKCKKNTPPPPPPPSPSHTTPPSHPLSPSPTKKPRTPLAPSKTSKTSPTITQKPEPNANDEQNLSDDFFDEESPPLAEGSYGAESSDSPSLLTPEEKSNPYAAAGGAAIALAIIAGVAFSVVTLAKRKRLAQSDAINPDLLASVAAHSPYAQPQTVVTSDASPGGSSPQQWFQAKSGTASTANNNLDEPKDMFELAQEQPDSYGSSSPYPDQSAITSTAAAPAVERQPPSISDVRQHKEQPSRTNEVPPALNKAKGNTEHTESNQSGSTTAGQATPNEEPTKPSKTKNDDDGSGTLTINHD